MMVKHGLIGVNLLVVLVVLVDLVTLVIVVKASEWMHFIQILMKLSLLKLKLYQAYLLLMFIHCHVLMILDLINLFRKVLLAICHVEL
ncbi:MAG: hypothetical protein DRI57_00215 [Deltaproteobacteria bacterium]|nr:MAG: hypothetical protein DRI57_00215 [Deltaproteobacteria bacterium]